MTKRNFLKTVAIAAAATVVPDGCTCDESKFTNGIASCTLYDPATGETQKVFDRRCDYCQEKAESEKVDLIIDVK